MPTRSEAFSGYLNDIYRQYDEQTSQGDPATEWAVLGSMPGADVEALCFLVLMQASESAQEDLEEIMAGVKAINQTKTRLCESIDSLNRRTGGESEAPRSDERLKAAARHFNLDWECQQTDADLTLQWLITNGAQQSNREAELLAAQYIALRERIRIARKVDEKHGALDNLNDLSELMQMRLQMILDRRSKAMETLSNTLKKMAETQEAIIENLK